MPVGSNVPPGLEAEDQWQPYKVWIADEWVCLGCGAKIVVGFGRTPLWERHDQTEMPYIHHTVNDC